LLAKVLQDGYFYAHLLVLKDFRLQQSLCGGNKSGYIYRYLIASKDRFKLHDADTLRIETMAM